MKPGLLKKFILAFSSLALILAPVHLSDACGWDGEEYSFTEVFDGDFFSPSGTKRFDLFSDVLYNFDAAVKDDHDRNTEEWQQFLGLSRMDAYHLVYETSDQQLLEIQNSIANKTGFGGIADALSKPDGQNVIDYLRFVRKCQPFVNEYDDWGGCFDKSDVFTKFFQEGETIASKATTDFMKVRIGYQLCRLANYMGEFGKGKDYYEQIVQPLKPESIVYYWAKGHYGASLKNEGRRPEAQYNFAQVYRVSNTKRFSSFKSIDYSEIDSALTLCQDPKDKISLYVLNSLERSDRDVQNMDAIYQLDPKSPELEVLLFKAINDYEKFHDFSAGTGDGAAAQLLEFCNKVIEGGQMYRPYVWQLSAGYLSFLNKDYTKAHEYYSQIKSTPDANLTFLKQYVTMLEVLLRAAETKDIDDDFEESMYRYMSVIESVRSTSSLYETSQRILKYIYSYLYVNYKEQGDVVKMELVYPLAGVESGSSLYSHADTTIVGGLLRFVSRTDLNLFEKALVAKVPFKRYDLADLQGTLLMRMGNLPLALTYLNQSDSLENISGQPFEGHLQDCIECEGSGSTETIQNKKNLVIRMIEFEKSAAGAKNPADLYFSLGNAYYNGTLYGPDWKYFAFSRPWGDFGDTTDPFETFWKNGKLDTLGLVNAYQSRKLASDEGKAFFYDCSKALSYYKKALNASKDQEFKARCVFMMAKCEENARQIGLGNGSHMYYAKLYNEYSKTSFYSEIIKECSYVGYYKELRDRNK